MKDKKYKIILYITLIPYLIVFLVGVYHSIFGYHLSYLDKNIYGFEAFLQPIDDIWFTLIDNPLLIVILVIMVIYQIGFFISKCKWKIKKILFYLSILCWILYLLIAIYYAIFGYCDGIFQCTNIYGFEAFYSILIWYGLVFTMFIPILPVTLIYIIVYIIKNKKIK